MGSQSSTRVNSQTSAVDVTRRRTAKKYNIIGHLLDGGCATERRDGFDDLVQFWHALQAGLHHRCVDPGGANRVDTDVALETVDRL